MPYRKKCWDCGRRSCKGVCPWCGYCDCVGNRKGDCIEERWAEKGRR